MGIPGKDTKLVDDKIPEERFRTLKNIGRGLTGRGARIDQDIDVLNNIRGNLSSTRFLGICSSFFQCLPASGDTDIKETYGLGFYARIEDILKEINFDNIWEQAKKKYKTIRIHESSISLWWKEVQNQAKAKYEVILGKIKHIKASEKTDDYGRIKRELKTLSSDPSLTEFLDFMKIKKGSKKFFSSLDSSSTELTTAMNELNSAIDRCNNEISKSLKMAIDLMEIRLNFFIENKIKGKDGKEKLQTDLKVLEGRFSNITKCDTLLLKNGDVEKQINLIRLEIKDIKGYIERIEVNNNDIESFQNASICIKGLVMNLKELGDLIEKVKIEVVKTDKKTCNSKIGVVVNLAESSLKKAELWSSRFKCSNKDLSKIRDNMKLINEKSNDISPENLKFINDLYNEIGTNEKKFKLYCVLCNKLPDYISKFDNGYLDSIVRIKDSTISVNRVMGVSKGWIPNFDDKMTLKLNEDDKLTQGADNAKIRYAFHDYLLMDIGKITRSIEAILKPFEKLTKSNCDEAIKAIDKFLDDNKDTNLLESRKIVAGGMKDCFDDSGKNWSQVREQWNKFMEESSDRIKKVLESAKLEIETLKSGGKLPGLSQLPSENSVIKPNDQKPDGQKPDSKKSGQKHRFFSGFRRSKK